MSERELDAMCRQLDNEVDNVVHRMIAMVDTAGMSKFEVMRALVRGAMRVYRDSWGIPKNRLNNKIVRRHLFTEINISLMQGGNG